MARLRTLVAFALSVALIPAGAALAQSSGGGREGAGEGFSGGGGSGATTSLFGTETVISIDFAGGTLPEYYNYVQRRTGVQNIILASEDLTDVLMPEVNLSNVQYADAVKLPHFLTSFPDDRIFEINEVGAGESIFVVSLRNPQESASSSYGSISIEFDGGSLLDYVNLVQDAADEQIVFVRGDAANFTMPPIHLENVSIHGALQAIDGDTRDLPSGERMSVSSEYRQGVYVIKVLTNQVDRGASDQSPVQTSTWTIIGLLGPGRLTIDDVLSAVEAAVEVSGTAGVTKIRFHEPSSLLIASGPLDTLQLIDRTLDRLEETAALRFVKYEQLLELESRLVQIEAFIQENQNALSRAEEIVASFQSGDPEVKESQARFYESRLGLLRDRIAEQKADAQAIRFKISKQD